jgi:hypothetical protein
MEAPRILLTGLPEVGMPDKGTWRKMFLERLAVVGKKAKEKLHRMQERYKKAYDAHVKARNAKLRPGDWVLVKVYAECPKLALPLAGPFEIIAMDENRGIYTIRTAEGSLKVPSDRVKPAPMPRDLPPEFRLGRPGPEEEEDEAIEYVIERLVSHGIDEEGNVIVRVRWAGYGSEKDTWEMASNLPAELLRRYERRKKLAPGALDPRH